MMLSLGCVGFLSRLGRVSPSVMRRRQESPFSVSLSAHTLSGHDGGSMADEDKNEWGWVGAIGAGLAVAAFFGIHNFAQLKAALGGTPAPAPVAAASPTCEPLQFHCGETYFAISGVWQTTGPCGATSCPLTGTFLNKGTLAGSPTLTFHLHPNDNTP